MTSNSRTEQMLALQQEARELSAALADFRQRASRLELKAGDKLYWMRPLKGEYEVPYGGEVVEVQSVFVDNTGDKAVQCFDQSICLLMGIYFANLDCWEIVR